MITEELLKDMIVDSKIGEYEKGIKLECIKIASNYAFDASDLIIKAKKLYDFICLCTYLIM